MDIVFLNGEFLPAAEARISPLDRGFLFGDGIYEVIPARHGRLISFEQHMKRMEAGLAALQIERSPGRDEWRDACNRLLAENELTDAGVYLHISRGADTSRFHGFPQASVKPTVFAMLIAIPPLQPADRSTVTPLQVMTAPDQRWRLCNIKSTALLGNVLHFQKALTTGHQEVALYNEREEITEGSASNIFIAHNGLVATPALDDQKLPGITRLRLLQALRGAGWTVEERVVSLEELRGADEIWFTNSAFDVSPAVTLDGVPVGDGSPGLLWEKAAALYQEAVYH